MREFRILIPLVAILAQCARTAFDVGRSAYFTPTMNTTDLLSAAYDVAILDTAQRATEPAPPAIEFLFNLVKNITIPEPVGNLTCVPILECKEAGIFALSWLKCASDTVGASAGDFMTHFGLSFNATCAAMRDKLSEDSSKSSALITLEALTSILFAAALVCGVAAFIVVGAYLFIHGWKKPTSRDYEEYPAEGTRIAAATQDDVDYGSAALPPHDPIDDGASGSEDGAHVYGA